MSAPSDFVSRWDHVGTFRLHALQWAGASTKVGDRSAATPVVLVPGLVTASRSMVPLARALAGRGFQVWALDPPGFGYSDKPTRALSMPEEAGILADWLRATGLAPARVLGNSFGSQVAAAMAAAHPDTVQRLVLLAPTAGPHVRRRLTWMRALPDPVGTRERTAGRGRARALDSAHDLLGDQPSLRVLNVVEYMLASLLRAVSTIRCAVFEEMESVLPHVDVPTLLLRAEHDHLSSQKWAEHLAAHLADGTLVSLHGLGHAAFYAAPDTVASTAAPFLASGQLTSTP